MDSFPVDLTTATLSRGLALCWRALNRLSAAGEITPAASVTYRLLSRPTGLPCRPSRMAAATITRERMRARVRLCFIKGLLSGAEGEGAAKARSKGPPVPF